MGRAGKDETWSQNCGGKEHGRRQSKARTGPKISTSENCGRFGVDTFDTIPLPRKINDYGLQFAEKSQNTMQNLETIDNQVPRQTTFKK